MPVTRNKPIRPAPPRDMPPQAWGKVRSEAARLGYSQQQIKDALGNNIGGRKTAEIIQAVRDMMNTEEAAQVRKARA